jgi:hypothetical protein
MSDTSTGAFKQASFSMPIKNAWGFATYCFKMGIKPLITYRTDGDFLSSDILHCICAVPEEKAEDVKNGEYKTFIKQS